MWQTTPRIRTPDVGHLRPIAIDTETYLFGPGRMAPPLVCVSLCEDGKSPQLLDADNGSHVVAGLLEDPDVLLVFHNAPYDLFALVNHGIVKLAGVVAALLENRVMDTGTWQRLFDIKNGWADYSPRLGRKPTYRLEELVLFWTGETVSGKSGDDVWRLRYHELKDVPLDQWPDEARKYAANDAWYTLRVWQQQYKEERVLPSCFATIRSSVALTAGAYHGLRTSAYDVDRLAYKLRRDTQSQQEELYAAGYLKVKKDKGVWRYSQNKAFIEDTVREAYEQAGVACPLTDGGKGTPEERAAKRKPSTSAETLFNSQHPHLKMLAEIAGDQKLLNTYVPLLRRGTRWPICPRYTLPMATGRTSASAPNVQNQPRKGGVRECFIPRKGFIYVGCDYNIAELRSLSQVLINMFGRSRMAEIILEGKDVHSFMAARYLSSADEHGGRFSDLTYEKYVDLLKNGDKEIRKLFKDMRQMMKAVDFGVPGGLGKETLREYAHTAYGVEMTADQAQTLIDFYKETFDEMGDYFSHFSKLTRGGNRFTTVQYGSLRERGNTGYCDGCNCVDFLTECLTKRGWVGGADLRQEDEILTKNADSGALEWQRPTEINLFPDYRGPLVEFSSTTMSAMTTPPHRWLVNDRNGNAKCVTSESISKKGEHKIHRTGEWCDVDGPYSDDLLELAGWFLTDGSAAIGSDTRISIYQTKKHNVRRIDDLFARLDIGAKRTETKRNGVVWRIANKPNRSNNGRWAKGKSPAGEKGPKGNTVADYLKAGAGTVPDEKVAATLGVSISAVMNVRRKHNIPPAPGQRPDGKNTVSTLRQLFPARVLTPEFISSLSKRQACLLVDVMLLGDGTRNNRGQRTFFTGTEHAAGMFQMLLVAAGLSSRSEYVDLSAHRPKQYSSMPNVPKSKGVWVVHVYKRTQSQVVESQVHRHEQSTGGVWCPTVPNGYFMARRNGSVYVTGNTTFQGLTADGALLAVWNVFFECYTGVKWDNWDEPSPLYQSRMPLFVHDEIVLESPIEQAQACAHRLMQVMCDSMNVYTPDIPAVAEPHMMRRWYKDAEPTFACRSCGAVSGSAKCKKCASPDGSDLVPWSPQNPAYILQDLKMPEDVRQELKDAGYFDPTRSWSTEDSDMLLEMQNGGLIEPDVPAKKRTDIEWTIDIWDMEMRARSENPDPWC